MATASPVCETRPAWTGGWPSGTGRLSRSGFQPEVLGSSRSRPTMLGDTIGWLPLATETWFELKVAAVSGAIAVAVPARALLVGPTEPLAVALPDGLAAAFAPPAAQLPARAAPLLATA